MSLQVFIDGAEVTDAVLEATSTHKHNRVYDATAKLPIDYAATDLIGKRLKIVDTDLPLADLDHHGTILNVSDNDEEDTGTTEVTSYAPNELWQWRPARDGDASPTPGNFSKPSFITRNTTGPQIMEEILGASVSAGGGPPSDAEGDLFIEMGSFATGGEDLSGAPTDYPMTIMQIAALLTETGELDIVCTPIDSGGNMARVDCYNGDYGVDRSTSVVFEYATGAHNVRVMRRTQDLTNACNKLWYYLGPKLDDQHWKRLITGDDPGLPNPPGGDIDYSNPLGDLINASRAAYGVRMEIRIYDSFNNESDAVGLYWRTWQNESILRQQPKTLVHVTPIRGLLPAFDVGDIVGVSAGAIFRGGLTGVQRVYERKLTWDTEGVVELAELVCSGDQEAA